MFIIIIFYNKYCSKLFDKMLIEHFTKYANFFNFYCPDSIYILFCLKLENWQIGFMITNHLSMISSVLNWLFVPV